MHMMRAIEFIAKARDVNLMNSLTEEEQQQQAELHEHALRDIAGTLGDDGPLSLELQRKRRARPAQIRGHPDRELLQLVRLMRQLLRGTEEEQEAARAAIRDMPEEGEDDEVSPEAEARTNELINNLQAHMAETGDLLDRANGIEQRLNASAPEASFLEMQQMLEDLDLNAVELDDSDLDIEPTALIVAIAFIVIVYLLWGSIVMVISAVLSLLFLLIFISLVGCGVASAFPSETGVHCARQGDVAAVLRCEMQCSRRVLSVPFQMAGQGLRQLSQIFSLAEIEKEVREF
jgi:hypothetical protein